jgi:hypothetical protein
LKVAYSEDLTRKIYFYRVAPTTPTNGWKLDRAAVVKAIEGHVGRATFYLDQGEDRITCAEVHGEKAPQCIKLYGIRRTNLPSRDSGKGKIGDLGLAVNEGLAEAVHLRLFPNGIIGFESFFYGPRIGRLQDYLTERCNLDVVVNPLYRADMLERALKFKDVRVLRVKLLPSIVSKELVKKAGLKGVLDVATNFDAGVFAEVTLRAEGFDDGFTSKVKGMLKQFRKEKRDPDDLLDILEIEGVSPQSNRVEPLNLLNDALQRVVTIPRESKRSRALDSPAAFAAIRSAYNDVKNDLPRDSQAP